MNIFYPDIVATISFNDAQTVTLAPPRERRDQRTAGMMDALWWHSKSRTQEYMSLWFNDPVRLDVEKGDFVELREYVIESAPPGWAARCD